MPGALPARAGVALVTGATGFVGSTLVRRLLAGGHRVRALSSGAPRHRLADVAGQIDWQPLGAWASGGDAAVPTAWLQGVDRFFHLAVAYDRPDVGDAPLQWVNTELPQRLLQALWQRDAAPPAGVAATAPTVAVLGDSFFSAHPPEATRQPRYTRSKQQLAGWLARHAPAEAVLALLRIEQVYGPGDSEHKVFARVTQQLLAHQGRIALTDGLQRRDFVHVQDVAEAALCLGQGGWAGLRTVPCGTGVATPVRSVFEQLHALCRSTSVLGFGDLAVDNRIDQSVADTRFLCQLGWQPRVPLAQGLAGWVQAQRQALQAAHTVA